MTAAALLAELRNRGATVTVTGDRLRVEAPIGTITPGIRQALATYKPELLRLLSARPLDGGAGEPCEHAAHDAELADWYRRNPHLTCARCFFAGRPLRTMLQ